MSAYGIECCGGKGSHASDHICVLLHETALQIDSAYWKARRAKSGFSVGLCLNAPPKIERTKPVCESEDATGLAVACSEHA